MFDISYSVTEFIQKGGDVLIIIFLVAFVMWSIILDKLFLQSGVTLHYAFSRFCKNKLARVWIYKGNRHNLYKLPPDNERQK